MNRSRTFTSLIAAFWCGLSAWQSSRSFARCEVSSAWIGLYWGLHLLMLAAPMAAVVKLMRSRATAAPHPLNMAAALAVLAYAPLLVAMRLFEMCLAAK